GGGLLLRQASTCEFGAQRVELRLPETAERIEPRIRLRQRGGVDRIDPPGALCSHRREPGVAEHPQVLGDRRLRNAELALDDAAEVPRGLLAISEQLKDAPADRITK